ncbi:acyl-ACP--UDP-N-acetylglucosamine O-acyltransferase, partial [Singulisphaera rosea]
MNARMFSMSRIDPRAELAFDVEIGPFCTIGPGVQIGRGTRLMGHVALSGDVTIGEFNTIGAFVAIGEPPQDVSYQGAATRVEIGDHNVFCEGVTIHRASEKEDGLTRIGHHNYFGAGAHVAHDCRLGDRIRIAERTVLGGHVHVENGCEIAEGVAIVHNVTIGGYSFVRARSKATQDVPPYLLVDGCPSRVRCVNTSRLRQLGFPDESILALRELYKLLYRAKIGVRQAAAGLRERGRLTPELLYLIDFVEAQNEGRNGR